MVSRQASVLLLMLSGLFSAFSHAGVYSDELTKCMIEKTSAADRAFLVKWVFEALSAHPEIRHLSAVSAKEKDASDRAMAAIVEKLMTKTCRKETVATLKHEGEDAFAASFGELSKIAMRELMGNPEVSKSFTAYGKYLDEKKLRALEK